MSVAFVFVELECCVTCSPGTARIAVSHEASYRDLTPSQLSTENPDYLTVAH